MASSSIISNLQKQINQLHKDILIKNKPIKNLEYLGINMKPCEYCKEHPGGMHFHLLE